MSVALAANAPVTFEIKSANLPLVALLLKSPDLGRLAAELAQRFGDMPDFFDQDPLLIDFSLVPTDGEDTAPPTPMAFEALLQGLSQFGARTGPISVR